MKELGHYHSIILYIPLALFVVALVWDVLYYLGRVKSLMIGHGLIILGVIALTLTMITGFGAAFHFDSQNVYLIKHQSLSYILLISASLYAGLRISYVVWSLPLKPIHFVFLSTLILALISLNCDYGFLIHSLP